MASRAWVIRVAGGCAACLGVLAAGCGPSVWESRFEPTSFTATPLEPQAPVTIRHVPWETLDRALREIEADITASEVHPDEWPAERKTAARAKLLRGLQVSTDPAAVRVLGRSVFRTTDEVRPEDGELEAFAREVGATMVVWTSNHLGVRDKVIQEPVTEYRRGWWDDYSSRGRKRSRGGSYSETTTTWVPLTVQADEYVFIAYYLHGT